MKDIRYYYKALVTTERTSRRWPEIYLVDCGDRWASDTNVNHGLNVTRSGLGVIAVLFNQFVGDEHETVVGTTQEGDEAFDWSIPVVENRHTNSDLFSQFNYAGHL